MLRESYPWKRELKRLRSQLARLSETPLNVDIEDFKVEKPLLYSAIVVRRLLESWKVTDATRIRKYRLKSFPSKVGRQGALMRLTMQGDIDKEFDLNSSKTDRMDAWNITSELLHSGFLNWEVDRKGRFVGVYFASKRNQATRLLRLRISDYLQVIDAITADKPREHHTSIDKNGRLVVQIS